MDEQQTFWDLGPIGSEKRPKKTLSEHEQRVQNIYDAYIVGRKRNPDATKREIRRVLRSGRIDYETLLARTRARTAQVALDGTAVQFVAYPEAFFRDGDYDADDLVALDGPKQRLGRMFDEWYASACRELDTSIDEFEARYIWLAARIPRARILGDQPMRDEANRQWQAYQRRYAELQGGAEQWHALYGRSGKCQRIYPRAELLAEVERLKNA